MRLYADHLGRGARSQALCMGVAGVKEMPTRHKEREKNVQAPLQRAVDDAVDHVQRGAPKQDAHDHAEDQ